MLLTLLTACGGGGSSNNNGGGGTTPPPTTYADISGNWGFAGTSTGATAPDSYVGGVLTGSSSDNKVTGTIHIINPNDPLGQNGGCYSPLPTCL